MKPTAPSQPGPAASDRPSIRRAIQILMWLVVAQLIVLLAFGAVAVLGADVEDFGGYVLPVTALMMIASVNASLCLGSILRDRFVVLMWFGLAATVVALGLSVHGAISLVRDAIDDDLTGAVLLLLILVTASPAIWVGHLALVTRRPLRTKPVLVLRGFAFFAIWLTGLAAIISMASIVTIEVELAMGRDRWGYARTFSHPLYAVGEISAGIAGFSLLASIALNALLLALMPTEGRRRRGPQSTLLADAGLALACPECACEQTVRPGYFACRRCGHRLFVALDEPRCVCGYVLYRLQRDRCPECGRAAPEHVRPARLVGEERFRRPVDEEQRPVPNVAPTLFAERLSRLHGREAAHATARAPEPPVERGEAAPVAPPVQRAELSE